eukprot:CFRG3734T1
MSVVSTPSTTSRFDSGACVTPQSGVQSVTDAVTDLKTTASEIQDEVLLWAGPPINESLLHTIYDKVEAFQKACSKIYSDIAKDRIELQTKQQGMEGHIINNELKAQGLRMVADGDEVILSMLGSLRSGCDDTKARIQKVVADYKDLEALELEIKALEESTLEGAAAVLNYMNSVPIVLNVGGVTHITTHGTLKRDADSWLCEVPNKRTRTEKFRLIDNAVFIDWDGERFRDVLQYLRDPQLFNIPRSADARHQLHLAAVRFGVHGLDELLGYWTKTLEPDWNKIIFNDGGLGVCSDDGGLPMPGLFTSLRRIGKNAGNPSSKLSSFVSGKFHYEGYDPHDFMNMLAPAVWKPVGLPINSSANEQVVVCLTEHAIKPTCIYVKWSGVRKFELRGGDDKSLFTCDNCLWTGGGYFRVSATKYTRFLKFQAKPMTNRKDHPFSLSVEIYGTALHV